jgi:glucosyl-3-phosphoglycerate synthase
MTAFRLLLPLRKDDPQADLAALAVQLVAEALGSVELMGIVEVPEGTTLSVGALPAQQIRDQLMALATSYPGAAPRVKPCVRVSHSPWLTVLDELREDPVDLVLLPLDKSGSTVLGAPLDEVLSRIPCDVIIARGMVHRYDRVLLPVRGGPHIELMLRLAGALHRLTGEETTLLVVTAQESPPESLKRLLKKASFKSRVIYQTGDPVRVIKRLATDYHALILGATLPGRDRAGLGKVPSYVLDETPLPVFVVRSFRPGSAAIPEEAAPLQLNHVPSPLSERVDRWFATNSFHWTEFQDTAQLLRWKEQQKQRISLVLPALNEEATIGKVIRAIKGPLMEEHPLLDELIVMDSDSSDRTREVAASLGVPVYVHQQVLNQEVGSYTGKGEALWKSLYVTSGDIVAWVDTDIVNIHPRFVLGIVGPLLRWPRIEYVKGFYQRPVHVGGRILPTGGGRVTELLARPLINLLCPELSGMVQPLSGEYAGRRSALEKLPFFAGYGVETGLLLDLLEMSGLSAIAQCNLEMRTHRNQSLENLSRMSFAILQVFVSRLVRSGGNRQSEDRLRTMKTIRNDAVHFSLEEQEITERERPPMRTIPAYALRFPA